MSFSDFLILLYWRYAISPGDTDDDLSDDETY